MLSEIIYLINIGIVFIAWLIFLPTTIFFLSEKIWILGIYHHPDCEEDHIRNKNVIVANAYLSIPLIVTFFTIIKTTIQNYNTTDTFILSLSISLVSLLSIRLLSNPSDFIKPKICKFFETEKESKIIIYYKERVMSFFHSFVCAAFIILFIMLSASIFLGDNLSIEEFKYEDVLFVFIFYIVGLFSISLIGEYILKTYPPINQIPCVPKV